MGETTQRIVMWWRARPGWTKALLFIPAALVGLALLIWWTPRGGRRRALGRTLATQADEAGEQAAHLRNDAVEAADRDARADAARDDLVGLAGREAGAVFDAAVTDDSARMPDPLGGKP